MPDRARQSDQEWPVAQVDEIPPGGRKLVEIGGRSIGVFNVHGTFVAVLNGLSGAGKRYSAAVAARRVLLGSRGGDPGMPVARLGI
jgi:hypothetical protein